MKNTLFQYHNGIKTVEDTELITLEEAELLWDKYFLDANKRLEAGLHVQMCIWTDADSNSSYHTILKEINYMDYPIKN